MPVPFPVFSSAYSMLRQLVLLVLIFQGMGKHTHLSASKRGLQKLSHFLEHLKTEYEKPLVPLETLLVDPKQVARQKEIDSFKIE